MSDNALTISIKPSHKDRRPHWRADSSGRADGWYVIEGIGHQKGLWYHYPEDRKTGIHVKVEKFTNEIHFPKGN